MTQNKMYSFFLEGIKGEKKGPLVSFILAILYLASFPYYVFVYTKALLYRWGFLRRQKLDLPVVSVGNITVGGTGKTPMVVHLARFYQKQGLRPAILLRGYKGKFTETVGLVTNGQEILMQPSQAGDEAVMMAQQLKDVPIIVGANRYESGKYAKESLGVDLVILDDGFQNLRLYKDLDIVTLDAVRPFGYGYLLPRGLLREPKGALKRADILVLTHVEQEAQLRLEKFKEKLLALAPDTPLVEVTYKPVFLKDIDGEEERKLDLNKKKIVAFSGIGAPHSFEEKLTAMGGDVIFRLRYPDHHKYTEEEILQVFSMAFANEADMIITTEKDAISLPDHLLNLIAGQKMTLWVLGIEVSLKEGPDKEKMEEALRALIEKRRDGDSE